MEATPTPNPARPKKRRSSKNRAREVKSMAGCCVFLRRPSSAYRLGYHSLDDDHQGTGPSATVTVVVGKERRVFAVDQLVLDTYPFRVLLEETAARKEERRGKALFIDVDAILFEHILWLARCHDRSAVSLLHQPDLKDIIDFYSQDA